MVSLRAISGHRMQGVDGWRTDGMHTKGCKGACWSDGVDYM